MSDVDESGSGSELSPYQQLRRQIRLLERGYEHGEVDDARRVLRSLPRHRRLLNPRILHRLASNSLPASSQATVALFSAFFPATATDGAPSPSARPAASVPSVGVTSSSSPAKRTVDAPEVEAYLFLLVTLYHLDNKNMEAAMSIGAAGVEAMGKKAASGAAKATLDPVAARLFSAYLLATERAGPAHLQALRSWLLRRLGVSVVTRHMVATTSVIINAILRIFIHGRMYTAAVDFLRQLEFPEGASEAEQAKYLYYVARVNAMEQKWEEASAALDKALAKPHCPAVGFRQAVMKLKVLVDMLAAKEFPAKSIFRHPYYRRCLAPYAELASAVRHGDTRSLNATLATHADSLKEDGMEHLVTAIKSLTTKSAIRLMAKAYKRMGMRELGDKLGMEMEDTEYCLIRAIRDGWVAGRLVHDDEAEKGKGKAAETEAVVEWAVWEDDAVGSEAAGRRLAERAEALIRLAGRAQAAMRFANQSWLDQVRDPNKLITSRHLPDPAFLLDDDADEDSS